MIKMPMICIQLSTQVAYVQSFTFPSSKHIYVYALRDDIVLSVNIHRDDEMTSHQQKNTSQRYGILLNSRRRPQLS